MPQIDERQLFGGELVTVYRRRDPDEIPLYGILFTRDWLEHHGFAWMWKGASSAATAEQDESKQSHDSSIDMFHVPNVVVLTARHSFKHSRGSGYHGYAWYRLSDVVQHATALEIHTWQPAFTEEHWLRLDAWLMNLPSVDARHLVDTHHARGLIKHFLQFVLGCAESVRMQTVKEVRARCLVDAVLPPPPMELPRFRWWCPRQQCPIL